jgi:hypothetical protein
MTGGLRVSKSADMVKTTISCGYGIWAVMPWLCYKVLTVFGKTFPCAVLECRTNSRKVFEGYQEGAGAQYNRCSIPRYCPGVQDVGWINDSRTLWRMICRILVPRLVTSEVTAPWKLLESLSTTSLRG